VKQRRVCAATCVSPKATEKAVTASTTRPPATCAKSCATATRPSGACFLSVQLNRAEVTTHAAAVCRALRQQLRSAEPKPTSGSGQEGTHLAIIAELRAQLAARDVAGSLRYTPVAACVAPVVVQQPAVAAAPAPATQQAAPAQRAAPKPRAKKPQADAAGPASKKVRSLSPGFSNCISLLTVAANAGKEGSSVGCPSAGSRCRARRRCVHGTARAAFCCSGSPARCIRGRTAAGCCASGGIRGYLGTIQPSRCRR